jgi:peptide/nickel transport system ATP-binding protein
VSALLEVDGLSVEVPSRDGRRVRLVDEVSFTVARGRTTALVGESGSGKSLTVLGMLGLLGRDLHVDGAARLDGQDLLRLPQRALSAIRGGRVGMIFQDPRASLDPLLRAGDHVVEALRLHGVRDRAEAWAKAVSLLAAVGIPEPAERARAYAHELSGGLCQRVMIAVALACEPALLVADEPTTALDVTIQAQVMDLLARLQRERGLGILLITHDLGLVAEHSDEVVVLYAGRVVEAGPTAAVLAAPRHRYTAGLLRATPRPGEQRARLAEIPGLVPDLRDPPPGCRFHDRCPEGQAACARTAPALRVEGDRRHRCHHPIDAPAGRAGA